MRDDDEPAQAEEVGAAVRVRVEARAEAARRRADQEPAQPAAQRGGDLLSKRIERRLDRSLEQLQGHVPREAVADDDVGHLAQQVAPLDVADEAEARRLQRAGVGLADEPVALLRLLADGEERHFGMPHAHDLLGEDGAHVRELDQVLGPGVGVRARVDQDRRGRRSTGAGSRSPAGARRAGGGSRGGRRRASRLCSRAETTASAVPSCDGAAGEEERALALLAHRVGRLLVHGDDLLGMDDLEAARERLEHVARAVEDGDDVGGRGLERAGDDLLRRPIAAHGVDGDADRRHPVTNLGSGRAQRLDLAAPIRAAGRADVVRPLRLMALLALDERGNRHLVRRPPLVAARL